MPGHPVLRVACWRRCRSWSARSTRSPIPTTAACWPSGTGDVDERLPGSVLILEPATGALRQKLPDMPGKVEAVFSVDSRFLITVNSSKKHPAEVRMWNPLTAELAGQISNPAELAGLTTIALSPDGRYLVTGHGDPVNPAAADKVKIKIWDLSTQKLVGTLPVAGAPGGYPIAGAGPAAITRLEFTRRGTLLASGDMAGNVRLWDFASRKLFAKQIAPQGRPIIYLAFNPAGTRLAVATDKADKNGLRCVRICNVDTGEELRDVEVALGVPNVVRFNQDGKLMAAATSAGGLFLWDAETFNPRAILHGEGNAAGQLGHGGVITCVAPLLSDKLLTGSVDKTVRIWDLKTRTAAAKAFNFNQAVSCMAVSPDGRWLAVGTGKYRSKFEAGELVICDLTNQQAPRSISQGITPVSLAYSPDGNALAVCSLSAAVVQAAHTVNIIDLRSGRATFINSPMGQSVAFSPDGLIAGRRLRGRGDRSLALGLGTLVGGDEALCREEAHGPGLELGLLARQQDAGLRQRGQQCGDLGRADGRGPDDAQAQWRGRGLAVLARRPVAGDGRA